MAETGTLVFLSGPNNPTSNNFLPPTLIAVIAAKDIAGQIQERSAETTEEKPTGN